MISWKENKLMKPFKKIGLHFLNTHQESVNGFAIASETFWLYQIVIMQASVMIPLLIRLINQTKGVVIKIEGIGMIQ